MLLAILPVTRIDLVFFKPLVNTVSVFDVVHKLTSVSALFVDFELTETVHKARLPLSQVAAPVCPLVRADAVEGIVAHLPLVLASVFPTILAETVLFTVEERANKAASILVGLSTLSVLPTVFPTSLIDRPRFLVQHLSLAVGSIFSKLPFVNIPIRSSKLTLALSHTVLPRSFILCAIFPCDRSQAMTKTTHPLAVVDSTRANVPMTAPLRFGCFLGVFYDGFPGLLVLKLSVSHNIVSLADFVSHSFKFSSDIGLDAD